MNNEVFISDIAARELTGHSRSSLFNKRQSGVLPYHRDHKTGRVMYRPDDLRRVFGLENL